MKKTMSLEQVEANRANARKSTGPKTAEGKEVSSMNAWKHGILAREVVLRGEAEAERAQEFRSLCRQFWEHLAPVGPMETMLVERMVTTYWRLHRVLISERGEIVNSVNDTRRMETRSLRLPGLDTDDARSSRSAMERAMGVLGRVRQRLEKEGELTEAAIEEAMIAFDGLSNAVVDGLKRVRDNALRDVDQVPAGEMPEGGPKALQLDRLMTYIDRELEYYQEKLPELREREEFEAEARRDAAFLPSPAVLDRILRYEGSLEKQLYRAMNQLERLQRARRGEVVPPPLTMEVVGG